MVYFFIRLPLKQPSMYRYVFIYIHVNTYQSSHGSVFLGCLFVYHRPARLEKHEGAFYPGLLTLCPWVENPTVDG